MLAPGCGFSHFVCTLEVLSEYDPRNPPHSAKTLVFNYALHLAVVAGVVREAQRRRQRAVGLSAEAYSREEKDKSCSRKTRSKPKFGGQKVGKYGSLNSNVEVEWLAESGSGPGARISNIDAESSTSSTSQDESESPLYLNLYGARELRERDASCTPDNSSGHNSEWQSTSESETDGTDGDVSSNEDEALDSDKSERTVFFGSTQVHELEQDARAYRRNSAPAVTRTLLEDALALGRAKGQKLPMPILKSTADAGYDSDSDGDNLIGELTAQDAAFMVEAQRRVSNRFLAQSSPDSTPSFAKGGANVVTHSGGSKKLSSNSSEQSNLFPWESGATPKAKVQEIQSHRGEAAHRIESHRVEAAHRAAQTKPNSNRIVSKPRVLSLEF